MRRICCSVGDLGFDEFVQRLMEMANANFLVIAQLELPAEQGFQPLVNQWQITEVLLKDTTKTRAQSLNVG